MVCLVDLCVFCLVGLFGVVRVFLSLSVDIIVFGRVCFVVIFCLFCI